MRKRKDPDIIDELFTEYNEALDERVPADTVTLPCIPARGFVLFPTMQHTFEIIRRKSVFAAKKAVAGDRLVFITTQTDTDLEDPEKKDVYSIGTIAYVKQVVNAAGGVFRCTVQGLARAEVVSFSAEGRGYSAAVARVLPCPAGKYSEKELEAMAREIKKLYAEFVMTSRDSETPAALPNDDDAEELFDVITARVPFGIEKDYRLLSADTLSERLDLLSEYLMYEISVNELEYKIHERVQDAINRNQRDFYIREQIAALQDELGENGSGGDSSEAIAFKEKLDSFSDIPEDAYKKINEEIDRYEKTPAYSQEAATIRTYLETVLSLPWDEKTEETADVEFAEKVLDEDHYGLAKVKERIIENIAVRALTPDVKGQIICLYGPPGVGKTSVAKSVARALGRKYVRVSLGGVRDESDIRGHRKTYVGAMPGRIVQALREVGVKNPVMLLDEIDKMSNDYRGDPSSAMLEVLDSEQHVRFRDHYTEVPFDLSDVLFITTANSISTVQPPLLDRMEVIELNSYTREEKFHIAKEHLVPKQLNKYGIKASQLRINDSAIYSLIDDYTREAGVRKLERAIASLCRKSAKKLVSGEKKVSVKASNINEFLGSRKNSEDIFIKKPTIGCVNGLAWTSVGGVIMPIECAVLEGKGRSVFTGSLGDVMKESLKIAVTLARELAKKYGIDPEFFDKTDLHIHAPEGAVPKDGPSAGITMTTALISALSGCKVRSDVAMTGEISLMGWVLPIGGLKEKSMAAYKAGIKTLIIPKGNLPDLDEIDDVVKDALEIIPVSEIGEVLDIALITDKRVKTAATPKKTARRGRKPKQVQPAEAPQM
ncbi:ATP-dependent Lon protease [Ruminococcus sp. YE71]|uniref:endopeptidase La n=1 Tax=unclassified Ruminococcus TaxID=2608920 RepID=UPI00088A41C6|nr:MULTISPECIES: endopeptidase La [unclassified Ruminococcus]SDA11065.1 ATP-dependent Lon protease [Ruminococcus sp. YE78]SFW14601.1 ATP-dependent Lon protease [Ruminococcus sp. YE71]